jgi:hypothetical protein
MAIAWGAKVSAEFRRKVIDLCEWLGADPSHLMAAMAFETGETFSASVRNRASGATGLIQFMPSTARSLGTTTDKLAAMTAEDQLDYVRKYFAPYRNKMTTLSRRLHGYPLAGRGRESQRPQYCSVGRRGNTIKTAASIPTGTARSPRARPRPKFKTNSPAAWTHQGAPEMSEPEKHIRKRSKPPTE